MPDPAGFPLDFLTRKRVELRQKLASLTEEFSYWLEQSAAAPAGHKPRPLEKHHRQIRRVVATLAGFADRLGQRLGQTADAPLERWPEHEGKILEAHRVWDFFRGKLALRKVEWFTEHLAAADDLAWACYQPFQLCLAEGSPARERLKEPPLVFFNGSTSPLIMARGRTYFAEDASNGPVNTPDLLVVLQTLPVPLIGLPWFQVRHLPETLLVAHEAGHCVETDFRLTLPIDRRLQAALAARSGAGARLPAWRAWAGEVFADLCGVLLLGPAFAGALLDFLGTDPGEIARECPQAPAWGNYPSVFLRVLLVLETLRQSRFETESAALLARWQATNPAHALSAFAEDIPVVAEALRTLPLPGSAPPATLEEILVFTPDQQKYAAEDAARVLAGNGLEGKDVRELFASAQMAFARDPFTFAERRLADRFLTQIKAGRVSGPREPAPPRGSAPGMLELLALDREAGGRLSDP